MVARFFTWGKLGVAALGLVVIGIFLWSDPSGISGRNREFGAPADLRPTPQEEPLPMTKIPTIPFSERNDAMPPYDSEVGRAGQLKASVEGYAPHMKGVEISRRDAGSATLEGTWMGADQQPVVRGIVRVLRSDDHMLVGQATAVTDERGRYTCWVQPGRFSVRFGDASYDRELRSDEVVRLDHSDRGGCAATVVLRPGPGLIIADCAVLMERVTGSSSWRRVVRSGKDGIAPIDGLPPGTFRIRGQFRRSGPGLPVYQETWVELGENQAAVTIELDPPSGSVVVTLTDRSGAVVSGAEVAARSAEGNSARLTTDETGVVEFAHLPRGAVALEVRCRGFAPRSTSVDVELGPKAVSIQLVPSSALCVRAVDELGRPIRGVLHLVIPGIGSVDRPWVSVNSDEEGLAVFPDLSPVPEDVVFHLNAHEPLPCRVVGGTQERLELRFRRLPK